MTKVQELKAKIAEYQKEVNLIQEECPHPPRQLKKEKRGDTGNYDQTQDGYWTENYCTVCEKFWIEDHKK